LPLHILRIIRICLHVRSIRRSWKLIRFTRLSGGGWSAFDAARSTSEIEAWGAGQTKIEAGLQALGFINPTPWTSQVIRVALEITTQPSATVTPTPTPTPMPETAAAIVVTPAQPAQAKSGLLTNLLWILASIAVSSIAISAFWYLKYHSQLEETMKSAVQKIQFKLHAEALAVLAGGGLLLTAVFNSPFMTKFVAVGGRIYEFRPFTDLSKMDPNWLARTSTPSPELRYLLIALLTIVVVALAICAIYRQPRLNRVATS